MGWLIVGIVIAGAGALAYEASKMSAITLPDTGAADMANYDKHVTDFAVAIAQAEGFGVPGSVPQRAHNPGDLGPGDTGVSDVIHAVGSDVSILESDDQGWDFLYKKLQRAFSGNSHTFLTSMSIEQFAQTYVGARGDWQDWADHVVEHLQGAGYDVSTSTTIQEYISL